MDITSVKPEFLYETGPIIVGVNDLKYTKINLLINGVVSKIRSITQTEIKATIPQVTDSGVYDIIVQTVDRNGKINFSDNKPVFINDISDIRSRIPTIVNPNESNLIPDIIEDNESSKSSSGSSISSSDSSSDSSESTLSSESAVTSLTSLNESSSITTSSDSSESTLSSESAVTSLTSLNESSSITTSSDSSESSQSSASSESDPLQWSSSGGLDNTTTTINLLNNGTRARFNTKRRAYSESSVSGGGKYYVEVTIFSDATANKGRSIGISQPLGVNGAFGWFPGWSDDASYGYDHLGRTRHDSGIIDGSYGSVTGVGDTISVLLDLDNETLDFWLNGVDQGQAFDSANGIDKTEEYHLVAGTDSNTGVREFDLVQSPTYTMPAGFVYWPKNSLSVSSESSPNDSSSSS